MIKMVRQTTFSGGEVDAINWKRTDLQAYLTCGQSLQNIEVTSTGMAAKRKGTAFDLNVTEQTDSNSQLFEFQDNNGTYYLIMSAPTIFYVFILNAGVLSLYQTVTGTPYQSADLTSIDYSLDNDSLVLAHPSYPQARLYVQSYTPSVVFAYEALNIYPAPSFDYGNINYNGFTVSASVTGNVLTFAFTGLGSDPGYTTAWIGGQIIGAGASDIDPIGYAIITNVVPFTAGTVTFTATVQIPFAPNADLPVVGSQYSVRQPVFTAATGYPAKVLFYQNRIWYGNIKTLKNTIFGSKINAPLNFDVGIGADTDAIVYTIGQSGAGGIVGLNGGKQLEVYTEFYEFVCPQDQNVALTPSTLSIRQQSAYGSSTECKPVSYLNDSYYISKTGNAIMNFHFNGIGLDYMSTNVSLASSHLVKQPQNRALLRGTDSAQDNFIYYLNDDDSVTAFQFANQTGLAALTPCVFGSSTNPSTTVTVQDICSLDNQIYFLKKYNLTNQYAIEHFDPTQQLDSYVTTTMDDEGSVTGLTNLVGYTVDAFFEGQDFGEYVVNGAGAIQVYNPNGYSGTILIGLIYDVNITPMYLYEGPIATDYFKNVSRIFTDYYQSLNFYVNGVFVPYQTYANIQAGLPLMLQSGTAITPSVNGWAQDSTFNITQHSPFPLNIISISYQIESSIE